MQDDRAPVTLQADAATVDQKQLVLIQMAVKGQGPLAEEDADHKVIHLSQVNHGERLGQPCGLPVDVYLFEVALPLH
jgi:hypothetical protein